MSISATSGYMSNEAILGWMEAKTDGLYDHMRDAMQGANTRADAESALDDIKAAITDSKDTGNADKAHELINDALDKYKDVPEVAQALQPIADELNSRYAQRALDLNTPRIVTGPHGMLSTLPPPTDVPPVTIRSDDVDAWTKSIGDKVDVLGKQDSMDMINIQQINGDINQAKQTASALIDAADKSSNAIINHIA